MSDRTPKVTNSPVEAPGEAAARWSFKDYRSEVKPVWCPGCGDFGVLAAVSKALASLQIDPWQVVVVSGIGCSSRLPYFMSTYGLHGVHGRPLPIATGVKLANPQLTVLALGGDGDLMSIGAGHLPHACARNPNITCIMMDNHIYGLTKAQASPTTAQGHKTKTTPYGVIARPLDPVLLTLSMGASFVARGYAAKANHLADIIVQAVQHRGFSFVHVHSPCTEFHNTYDHYDSVVEEIPASHDPTNLRAAMDLALSEEKVPLGVFFKQERPVLEEEVRGFEKEVKPFDMVSYLKRFT